MKQVKKNEHFDVQEGRMPLFLISSQWSEN